MTGKICAYFGGVYSKAANLSASARNLTELNLDFNDTFSQI